jgi:hypothetical protein
MRPLRNFLIFWLAVSGLMFQMACKKRSDSGAQAAGGQNPAQAQNASPQPAPGENQAQGQNATAQAPPAANPVVTISERTPLHVRLLDPIGSARDTSGETFRATLEEPIVVNGAVVVPRDANVAGKVLVARSSGHLQTPAELVVTLTSLEAGGRTYDIVTSDASWRSRSHKKRNAKLIGGGAGVGALIGALVGHGKGAAIGAGIGAGGGTATAYATGKKEISIPAETRLRFILRRPVTLSAAR